MKEFFKTLLAITFLLAVFFVGFKFGSAKEKSKIPNFQEDV